MNLLDSIGLDADYIIIGILCSQLIVFIMLITLIINNRKLKKKYKEFMKGADGVSLESAILSRFSDINMLKEDTVKIKEDVTKIVENLLSVYQKMGIVKYDAFKEMGGKLSFSLCILNDNNDGVVLTSMHSSREGCYTYVKEIIKGESFVLLSEEEKKSLQEALNKKNYMQ